MKRIKQVFSLIVRVFLTIRVTGFFSINEERADYIIWAPAFFSIRFLYGDNLQKVLFSYYHLKKSGKSVTVWVKPDVGRFYSKNIIFFGGHEYNKFNFSNYMDSLRFITKNLELQGNNVFPNSDEVMFWENKAYMHRKFELLGIRTPETKILNLDSVFPRFEKNAYPLLVKEEHSCSAFGIHKIKNFEELRVLVSNSDFKKNNKNLIIQELLNMRRDLRVILVDEEIVLHYWRINLSDDWKPTSTGYGSRVDFDFFPDDWKDWIVGQFKKLNIRTGAFDIAWQNDDLTTEPYILEVSTFYQPNPKPKSIKDLNSYGNWKKSVRIFDSYQSGMVDVIFRIQEVFVKKLINRR